MCDVHQPVDAGAVGCARLDRGEVDDHIGLVGGLLQKRAAERRRNKVDVRVLVFMRPGCDAADTVSGGDQLPRDSTPHHSSNTCYQNPHARPPLTGPHLTIGVGIALPGGF